MVCMSVYRDTRYCTDSSAWRRHVPSRARHSVTSTWDLPSGDMTGDWRVWLSGMTAPSASSSGCGHSRTTSPPPSPVMMMSFSCAQVRSKSSQDWIMKRKHARKCDTKNTPIRNCSRRMCPGLICSTSLTLVTSRLKRAIRSSRSSFRILVSRASRLSRIARSAARSHPSLGSMLLSISCTGKAPMTSSRNHEERYLLAMVGRSVTRASSVCPCPRASVLWAGSAVRNCSAMSSQKHKSTNHRSTSAPMSTLSTRHRALSKASA
mmetsp:Transcript_34476/g.67464  ORF Transcript_34476/g.67464 Transcript_34476/m.67464 type:complete len:264 (-) Transcript_34476:531-1322(-)